MTKKVKMPKELFITKTIEGNDQYFLAFEKAEECDDGIVCVYTLKETKRKRTVTVIE